MTADSLSGILLTGNSLRVEGNPNDFFGFSIGSGIAYINRKKDKPLFSFDIAYQCRFGNNVGASFLKGWGFSQDVREHMLLWNYRDLV